MAIHVFVWLVMGVIAGAATVAFWDRIKEWATHVVGFLIDGTNKLIEVTSNALVYLIKVGKKYYTEARLYVENTKTGATRMESKREEINKSDIPKEELDIMSQKKEQLLLKQGT